MAVHWKGGKAGAEGDASVTLVSKTLTAGAAVNNLDGTVTIPVAHAGDFDKFDYVVLDGTDAYDGNHLLVDVPDTSNITIRYSYTEETFAVTDTAKSSNWQDENGVPVVIPVATNLVVFDDSAGIARAGFDRHEEGKHWNCVDSIGVGDTGGLELSDMVVEKSFTGLIGIDSANTISPFHVSISDNGSIVWRADTTGYIECSANDAVSDVNIPLLIFDCANGFLRISSDVNSASWTSTWDSVKCISGGVLELASGTVVTKIETYHSNVTIKIGTDCVDVKGGNTEIDLYLTDSSIHTESVIKSSIACEGAINFGSAALTLTKNF